jgi:HEAT repeat protein
MNITILIVTFTILCLTNEARSETYKYVDKNGTIIFTDDASKLPNNYVEQQKPAALSNTSGDEVEKFLIDLKSQDVEVRIKDAKELAKQHHITGVRLVLKDPDGKVRQAVILNLSISPVKGTGRRDPEAVAIFIESLKDRDANVREAALRQLKDYATEAFFNRTDVDPDICQSIAELLNDPKENIRWQAADMLENCRVKSVEDKLLYIANDRKESVRVRGSAIRDLSNSKIKDLDETLIKILQDESEGKDIRRTVIDSLGKLKSSKAVDRIIPYIYDKDQQVHRAAVSALGNIGDPRGANALADVLVDGAGRIDSLTLGSLTQVSSPEVLPKLLKIKSLLTNNNLKMQFAGALGATRSDSAVAPLLELILDKDVGVQSWAARALERFDSPQALKTIIEASQKEPGNASLSSLAKKAQRQVDFPEEALKEKEKQKEGLFVVQQEQDINKIYNRARTLFREKKYEKALPEFYEALDRFEKLYASHPAGFRSSLNQISMIRSTLASYYRWKVKDPEKAIIEYTKVISILEKYEREERATMPYWFALGEVYEKDVKNYQKAVDCYKKMSGLLGVKNKKYQDEEIFGKWFIDWVSFLQERISVIQMKKQQTFSHRILKYPNVEYSYFFAFGGLALPVMFIDDEDVLNSGREYYSIEALDKLYAKCPDSYQVMLFGIALFRQFLKDNMVDKAIMLSEKLIKYYPYDLNMLMLQFEVADIYKAQNSSQKYKETIDRALRVAKSMSIEMVLGSDPRFSSPEKTWKLFVESLKKRDLNTVVECFSPMSQQKYREMFTLLKEKLDEIASDMGKITMVKKEDDRAEYEILRTQKGQQISYGIYFVNVLGEWKIEQF